MQTAVNAVKFIAAHAVLLVATPLAAQQVSVDTATPNPPHQVTFVDPQRYRDAGPRYGQPDPAVLALLERHILAQAQRCLGDTRVLKLQLLNLDLAGDMEMRPRLGGQAVRVLRSASWPRMAFEYSVSDANGRLIAHGHEQLSDQNYQFHLSQISLRTEALRYETRMFDAWFERSGCRAHDAP